MRNYGLGDYTQYILGRPRLVRTMTKIDRTPFECPNCRSKTCAEIQVVLREMPLLAAEYGLGTYLSCPACPWASPMMIVGIADMPEWLEL